MRRVHRKMTDYKTPQLIATALAIGEIPLDDPACSRAMRFIEEVGGIDMAIRAVEELRKVGSYAPLPRDN